MIVFYLMERVVYVIPYSLDYWFGRSLPWTFSSFYSTMPSPHNSLLPRGYHLSFSAFVYMQNQISLSSIIWSWYAFTLIRLCSHAIASINATICMGKTSLVGTTPRRESKTSHQLIQDGDQSTAPERPATEASYRCCYSTVYISLKKLGGSIIGKCVVL